MQEIHCLLDDHPELSHEMVLLDIRNRQANAELEAYNSHGVFVYKHKITIDKKNEEEMLIELYELKRNNPELLMQEITNLTQNIRRINSNIKKEKYKDKDELNSWNQNLQKAETRKTIIQTVISK
ncbi:hypothetical protein MASR1M31_03480 [Porphyromonadaceae bacterium]